MAKLDKDKWITKGFTNKELKEILCPNGSLTCGLLKRLYPNKPKRRCNLCRSDDKINGYELDLKIRLSSKYVEVLKKYGVINTNEKIEENIRKIVEEALRGRVVSKGKLRVIRE